MPTMCSFVALVSEKVLRDVSRLDIRDIIAGIAGTNAGVEGPHAPLHSTSGWPQGRRRADTCSYR
jgi:hypothetical protein